MTTTDGATAGDALTAEALAAMEDTVLYAGSWTVAEILDRAPVVLTEHVPALLAEVRRLTAALAGLRQSDAEQRDITREALATAQHAIDALRALPNTTP